MIKQVLIDAKAMIDTPQKWLQGWPYSYRAADGKLTHVPPDMANCYCASFAIASAAWKLVKDYVHAVQLSEEAEQALIDAVGPGQDWVARFNDSRHTTHEMMMQAFDKAIEEAA